jgi:trehalose 6-phosphate synthase complex regulatory subunit
VADVVSRINSRFSTLTYQPVVFLHTQDLTFSQYLALLTVADAFLVTSVREGMALRTHEFVECQETRHRPLILSEFTGSYTYRGFRSCIAINPWDRRGTANAIRTALTMSDEEAGARWEDLHAHVVAQSAQAFVTTFLQRCLRANIEHSHGVADAGSASAQIAKPDVPRLLSAYKHSDRRLLLLDLEGTLWLGRDPRANEAEPPKQVLDVVAKLAEDVRNEVWLLSGLPVKGVLEKVAQALPSVGIVYVAGSAPSVLLCDANRV